MKKFRLIVFVMLTGFGAAITGFIALAQSRPAPSNPFLAYADVFPGQPASAIATRAFSCLRDYDHASAGS